MSSHLQESTDDIQELIRERIRPAFPEFLRCRNAGELRENPVYQALREDIRRALETPQSGDFRNQAAPPRERYRFVAWNIERGSQLVRQLEQLRSHPGLKDADVLLLTETDVGMARSGNVDIARTMAAELGMCYTFVPCYLSLVKGSGVERLVDGENEIGLHGNAILSRYPLRDIRAVHMENGIDKVASNEKRLGSQTSITATIDLPQSPLATASIHLCAQSSREHRVLQMRQILDALPAGPAVIGGDWNTSTYNSSSAMRAILGFWRRVFMGVSNVIRNHYLYPEAMFERQLFELLEARSFEYKQSNALGDYTVLYDMHDPRADGSLREWVPDWCFPFIFWSLREHQGRCPFKLDWFATRGVRPAAPEVLHEPRKAGYIPLSDHDAIAVDIALG